jgi:4-diphosphocytidyl-2-C-methyl-D-erythritol kinase
MDTTLSLISPAKLNLFLHINGKRPAGQPFAGYHELQSVFQLLDRGDVLHFRLQESPDISIAPDFPDIPLQSNLIYRAAQALKGTVTNPEALPGVHIHLEKNLPMGGGVGGGSSNAATTLLALNYLWKLHLSEDQLASIGASLGADIPIFVRGRSAWAEGIGDILTPITLSEDWYVILCPECHINTAEIFSHERLTRDTPKMKIAPALEGQDNKQQSSQKIAFQDQSDSNFKSDTFLSDQYRNDCQTLVSELYPDVGEALAFLSQFSTGRLTGTGACCFARFDNEAKAKQVLNEARSKFKGFIAKGVNLSPAIQRLAEAERSQ